MFLRLFSLLREYNSGILWAANSFPYAMQVIVSLLGSCNSIMTKEYAEEMETHGTGGDGLF